jgi:hypothetical protein
MTRNSEDLQESALGRKLTAAGRGSSNPRRHQKTMLLDLSKLFIQSLLPRQLSFFNFSILQIA